ncbi:MAG: 50S ribosomal protein L11 methyltransferase [Candidatus Eisenbacteria sp.]|nr:50S ribosomal protein L11 methyltransferase [Candidatus Eisenbacteria bacterium]
MGDRFPLKWKSCYVRPSRGLAFFDSLLIEADSIRDSRWDRVLPILEEEQIFMSRLMGKNLAPGMRVLDVGTGSGIFAIVAARVYKCRVLAIDVSPRACMFAKQNAAVNQLDPIEGPDAYRDAPDASICVAQEPFDENFAVNHHGLFDAVILSPPYNPTHPGFRDDVALHAFAGPDGQLEFEKQIALVPQCLDPDGGICIGNQMTTYAGALRNGAAVTEQLRGKADSFHLIRRIRAAFPGGGKISCVPILPDFYPVKEFLVGQYANILQHYRDLASGRGGKFNDHPNDLVPKTWELAYEKMKEKLSAKGGKDIHFALIYYEIVPSRAPEWSVEAEAPSWTPAKNGPGKTWADRVHLHKRIVEERARPHLLPLPSLLGANGPGEVAVTDERILRDEDTGSNPTVQVDGYIAREALLRQFRVIFLDTAPIFPTRSASNPMRTIVEERRIWLTESLADEGGKSTLNMNLLCAWKTLTKQLQRSHTGPFAHSAFHGAAGQGTDWDWPNAVVTLCQDGEVRLARSEKMRNLRDRVRKAFEEARATEADQERDRIKDRNSVEAMIGYACDTLEDLNVGDFRDNFAALEGRLGAEIEDDDKQIDDLLACHATMHESLHDSFSEALPTRFRESALYGVPLGFNFHVANPSRRDFPLDYRGAFWLYLIPFGDWNPNDARAATRLLRYTWLVCLAHHSLQGDRSLRDLWSDRGRSAAAHNLPHSVSLAMEDLIEHEASSGSECGFRVPVSLFWLALKSALLSRAPRPGSEDRLFLSVPRLRPFERQILTEGLGDSLVQDLVKVLARPEADSRLAEHGLLPSDLHRPAVKVFGSARPADLGLDGERGEYCAAILFGIILTVLKEAIQHTELHLQTAESTISHIRFDIDTLPRSCVITVSNPTWEKELKDSLPVNQDNDLQLLADALPSWTVMAATDDGNSKERWWVRKIHHEKRALGG